MNTEHIEKIIIKLREEPDFNTITDTQLELIEENLLSLSIYENHPFYAPLDKKIPIHIKKDAPITRVNEQFGFYVLGVINQKNPSKFNSLNYFTKTGSIINIAEWYLDNLLVTGEDDFALLLDVTHTKSGDNLILTKNYPKIIIPELRRYDKARFISWENAMATYYKQGFLFNHRITKERFENFMDFNCEK